MKQNAGALMCALLVTAGKGLGGHPAVTLRRSLYVQRPDINADEKDISDDEHTDDNFGLLSQARRHVGGAALTNIVTVDFRGDTLFGFQEGENTFVGLKPIVEAMGLDWSAQYRRVKRDPILSEGIAMMATPFGRGGDQEAVCLRLDLVNGWLFTIQADRIKDEAVRQKVVTYQRECHRVLHEHFTGKRKAPEGLMMDDEVAESENTRLRMVTESRQTFGTQAAAQLWFQLGLPVVPAMLEDPRQANLFSLDRVKHAGSSGTAA